MNTWQAIKNQLQYYYNSRNRKWNWELTKRNSGREYCKSVKITSSGEKLAPQVLELNAEKREAIQLWDHNKKSTTGITYWDE